jgi:LPPG:FO 2-phospho-L-lactate transferase
LSAGGKKVGVIGGGSGSSKFLPAIGSIFPRKQINPVFIANVGDNFWRFGLYICPDLDIATFSLAGILETRRGWGIFGDSYNFLKEYSKLSGGNEWFNIGDRDIAVSAFRTAHLRSGLKLSEVTRKICDCYNTGHKIIPASNDEVQTFVKTSEGRMHLQDFWVRLKGEPEVKGVSFDGIDAASPSEDVLDAIKERAIILPANPVSSILPTISLRGVEETLARSRVIAISPFVGKEVFSGPAPKFMTALGHEPSSYGVAKLYSRFVKYFVVHNTEPAESVHRITDLGIECISTDVRITSASDGERIVRKIVELL